MTRRAFVCTLVLWMTLIATAGAGGADAQRGGAVRARAVQVTSARAHIGGFVVTRDEPPKPVRQARVRVRERTGRVIDTTITDNEGRFLFELEMAGSFFVEVVDESGKVLAVEDVGQVAVTVGPGHSSSTILRLPTRLTGGWKEATAPTILGAAAAAGIGTFVASGQPASPER